MKIDNYCCATDDDLYVYLPLRFYELTLKHRLLDQLGGFSHLLLDALTLLPEQGIGWVLEVTGLYPQQLQPILNRLNGLGLMNGGQLSQRGERLTVWKHLLHGQTRYVWLDGHHKSHSFCGDASLDVMELHEDDPFVIRRWNRGNSKPRSWSCQDWNEDCERQRNRILRYPDEYLGAVFETFRDCFIDTGFSVQEWELNVRYVSDKSELCALEVQLEPADLLSGSTHEFRIASPVLCLDTRYRLPDGAPVELRELQPEDQRRAVSFGRDAPNTELLLEIPASPWIWPEVNEPIRRQAVNLLFQNVAISAPQAEALFNRDHNLAERWQNLGFGWSAVEARLQEVEGVHRIKGNT
ncbi:hypothetical protein [Pokkaliibacter plantistimulans]|uniref:hypothetical protein n=1 Tax=Pokkaliibacter plantistimulans TaxID=1635171 RepID=UPI0011B08974|nr:hypothetical protein [Pokkaliibacter plantistimulans]